ncbi:MAG: DUF2865 domain-containing protein [Alphaproteobacteria bacterium]|nr:MAG: DUF2865 domain-containing protein [Alphaproteobacteria bacterium]
MLFVQRYVLQALVLLVAAFAGLAFDVSDAYAQSNACARLQSSLRTLDRNSDFRESRSNSQQLKQAQREVQRAESSYVREGCNDDAKAGRKLNAQCQQIARRVLDARDQVKQLQGTVDTGDAVAGQREAILQEMSRFGCDDGSRVNDNRNRGDRGNLFEQLFDVFTDNGFDGEGGVRGDEFNPYGDYHTVRTLCVRKSDGFYWPISYSTLVDYVPNDYQQCQAMCPTLDVDLYYYDNPGQEPEQMVNQNGEPYSSLPNAFKFRTEFDEASKCQQQATGGAVGVETLPDGRTRAIVTYEGVTFPLPVRDPRNITNFVDAPATVAEANVTYVDVPLPRPRPAAPGETPVVVAVPVAPAAAAEPERVVSIGGKRVRIVGPDTPYAQVVAAGT